MLKKMVPTILVIALLLSACSNPTNINTNSTRKNAEITSTIEEEEQLKEATPYLSITETYYIDDKEEKMKSRVITYDGKTAKEIGQVPYESDYPLTCYDRGDNSIYYTGDDGKRYQIYRYDATPYKCATDFCQFNYLSLCEDKFFSLAVHSKHSCENPIVFDKDFKDYNQIIEDPKDDLMCWTVGMDYKTHTVYFSSYSDSERRKLLDTEKTAKTTIYSYKLNTGELKTVYEKRKYVSSIAAKDGMLYMLIGTNWELKDKKIVVFDTNTGIIEKSNIKLNIRNTSDMEIIDDKLYYIGTEFGYDGVFSYDLNSGKKETVLKQNKNEFINGFSLNY